MTVLKIEYFSLGQKEGEIIQDKNNPEEWLWTILLRLKEGPNLHLMKDPLTYHCKSCEHTTAIDCHLCLFPRGAGEFP